MKNDIGSTHAVVSDFYGTPCGVSDYYIYVENCRYDRRVPSFRRENVISRILIFFLIFSSAFYALDQLYGNTLTFPSSVYESSDLLSFDQVRQ